MKTSAALDKQGLGVLNEAAMRTRIAREHGCEYSATCGTSIAATVRRDVES